MLVTTEWLDSDESKMVSTNSEFIGRFSFPISEHNWNNSTYLKSDIWLRGNKNNRTYNCLQIVNIIFTQLTVTTSNGKNNMETRVDDGDVICSVLHQVDVKKGGSTMCFDSLQNSENMKETCSMIF